MPSQYLFSIDNCVSCLGEGSECVIKFRSLLRSLRVFAALCRKYECDEAEHGALGTASGRVFGFLLLSLRMEKLKCMQMQNAVII